MKYEIVSHHSVSTRLIFKDFAAPFSVLVQAFGDPRDMTESGEDKVRAQWSVQFEDGTIATIYDWKWDDAVPVSAVNFWNIGGVNAEAFDRVSEAVKAAVDRKDKT